MTLIAELDGLQQGITAAVSGAIGRAVTVLHREPDGQYEGPFPLIMVTPQDYDVYLINNEDRGQDNGSPSVYGLVIYDRIQRTSSSTILTAASQSDVYALIDAINAYFSVKANMALPNQSAKSAGGRIRFRFDPFGMYKRTDAGIGPVAIGVISVIGKAQGDG